MQTRGCEFVVFETWLQSFADQHRRLFGTIILRVSYGKQDPEYTKDLIHRMDVFLRGFFEYVAPGRLFVSSFPAMRHIPSWFPGAGWKRTLTKLGDLGLSSIQEPWDNVKAHVVCDLAK
jgi:hypothetical protein